MIPVTTNHLFDITHSQVFPLLVADMLPARNLLQHHESVFIAGVEKMRRLRIVRRTHDVAFQFLLQNPRIALLHSCRHCLSDKRKCLMSIESAKLEMLTVEHKSIGSELCFAKTNSGCVLVR